MLERLLNSEEYQQQSEDYQEIHSVLDVNHRHDNALSNPQQEFARAGFSTVELLKEIAELQSKTKVMADVLVRHNLMKEHEVKAETDFDMP